MRHNEHLAYFAQVHKPQIHATCNTDILFLQKWECHATKQSCSMSLLHAYLCFTATHLEFPTPLLYFLCTHTSFYTYLNASYHSLYRHQNTRVDTEWAQVLIWGHHITSPHCTRHILKFKSWDIIFSRLLTEFSSLRILAETKAYFWKRLIPLGKRGEQTYLVVWMCYSQKHGINEI